MDRGAWRVQSSSGSRRGGGTQRTQELLGSLSTAGCAWPGGSGSPGDPPLRSPWTQKSPAPRSAPGTLGVLARGAGAEVAVTKVRESPLGLSGPARPVSSTGPADPGFLTCDPPPSRDSIPEDAGLLAPPGTRGQKGPGSREETAVSHQDSVCSPSPSAASSLPRGFGGTEPDTSRSPARDRLPGRPPASSPAPEPRAPRSALALLPAAGAFDGARRGAPRRPTTARSSDPQTSLGDAPLSGKEEAPSRKDVRTRNRL
uniref:Uncharacterized protein n=1 Tax=Rangifer tarandus platyrhynchus TaxID=3082113 RepID=A0ACB0EZZ2_RANTA|nr:unnamed protein product [Rangifer tarandus platyrhynchus]